MSTEERLNRLGLAHLEGEALERALREGREKLRKQAEIGRAEQLARRAKMRAASQTPEDSNSQTPTA